MSFIEENKNLNIKIKKEDVLKSLNCGRGDILYDSISSEFERLYPLMQNAMDLRRSIYEENNKLYVLITAGEEISNLSEQLFAKGEGIAGLIVNNAADEALFKADSLTADRIKYLCAEQGKGIKKRYEAPTNIPLSEQRVILNKARIDGVTVTEGMMFNPTKTMGYILELTDDEKVFNAQHDCAACPNLNCPRRSSDTGKKFDVISEFEYMPSTADGVCIDIGTTTVAAICLENGKISGSYSEMNRQRRFGADVLSRIDAANRGRGDELKAVIDYQIKECLKAIGGEGKRCVIAANTTMVSLLMGYDCKELGMYPFKPYNIDNIYIGNRTVIGGISAFVGGDITSGLYMTGFNNSDDINLFIDLGTNGEMAIGNKHRILCTSTAAGPAFEGGRIKCGTGSVKGAVCAIDLKEQRIETIGNEKPCGICGTGITELVSELKDIGAFDRSGLFKAEYETGFEFAENMIFTQSDIREFQMAKSAVRAGTEILISEYGCGCDEIRNVYIAGGFGERLNIDKACNVGLLPPNLKGKITAVGNSSLGGAVKFLENENAADEINKIKSISKDFPLAEHKAFTDLFMEYMSF